MIKATNKRIALVFIIFTFAFLYRFLLMTYGTYPSGADIGLHNSIIHSILNQGNNVDFLYNYYHMGGGLSLTFPGYHIFVAQLMLLTGLTEYLVHTLVVSLFSSVIVLVSYLVTRAVWKESVALVVAFLVAISRFDFEMLFWGGYPNVVTLLLIPVTFYLYIQKDRFSRIPFYISTSLLVGSIFISHSLSSVVFVCILFSVIFCGLVFGQKIGTTRFGLLRWLLPVGFGALLVSPYLVQIIPAYLANSTNAEINQATVATRILPLELILPLFAIVGFFFLLSKKHHKRYFMVPTVLLVLWMLVPTVFTQGYLFGMYTDFHRFLYFLIFPLMILIGLFIDLGSEFFARVSNKYQISLHQPINSIVGVSDKIPRRYLSKFLNNVRKILSQSNLCAVFLISLLLVCFFFLPLFVSPSSGVMYKSFYQAMNEPLYDAMDWAKTNTSSDATFVTEAYYGWWFAGFAQRRTWSAVEPQFLSLSREFSIAQMATNLLDTDYLSESSFSLSDGEVLGIQARQDGGYMSRHNPQVLTCLNWTYSLYPFFNFNSNQTKILFEVNGVPQSVMLDDLSVLDMYMANDTQHVTVAVVRGNEHFTCTQFTTVYQGSKFVDVTTVFEVIAPNVSLSWMQSTLEVAAVSVGSERPNSIGFLAKGVKVFGQVIFTKNLPATTSKSYSSEFTEVHLDYNLCGKRDAEIQLLLTTYCTTNYPALYTNPVALHDFFNKQIDLNLEPEVRDDLPLPTPFNYALELKTNNINYVAMTRYREVVAQAELKLKFVNDPLFSLVFINNEVAIFEVK